MKSIRKLLVRSVGVFLLAGVLTSPVYARSFDTNTITKDGTIPDVKNGDIASLNTSNLTDGWNIVNGDPYKVTFVKDGEFVSGWLDRYGWYYFDPDTHYMLVNVSKTIDGKEYYFDYGGQMVNNVNYAGSYYGADGSKQGSARVGERNAIGQSIIDNIHGWINDTEVIKLIKEGKIKVKRVYLVMNGGGSSTTSSSNNTSTSNTQTYSVSQQHLNYYLLPEYKGTVGMTDAEWSKYCKKNEEEFQEALRKTLDSMSPSDFN